MKASVAFGSGVLSGDQGRKVVRCIVPSAAAPAWAMIWSGFWDPPVVMTRFFRPSAAICLNSSTS